MVVSILTMKTRQVSDKVLTGDHARKVRGQRKMSYFFKVVKIIQKMVWKHLSLKDRQKWQADNRWEDGLYRTFMLLMPKQFWTEDR